MKHYPESDYHLTWQAPPLRSWATAISALIGLAFVGAVLLATCQPAPAGQAPFDNSSYYQHD